MHLRSPGAIPSACSQRAWGPPLSMLTQALGPSPQHAHRGTGLGEGMEYLRPSSLPQWPTISHQANPSPLETLQTLQGSLKFPSKLPRVYSSYSGSTLCQNVGEGSDYWETSLQPSHCVLCDQRSPRLVRRPGFESSYPPLTS